MNYNINDNNDFEELSSDIRSNREEEFFLNLRIKMDKKLLDELSEFFGGEKSGEYPLALKKLVGGKLPFDVYMANSSGEAHPLSINMADTGITAICFSCRRYCSSRAGPQEAEPIPEFL